MRTQTREPLSRERVLRAALAFVDAHGLEALSMRRLGRELGVEAMSLYNHVTNKDEIVDGIVDLVVGEIEVPPRGTSWRKAMRRRAASTREVLARHPWANGLFESNANPSPSRLRYTDAVLGLLRDGGFTVRDAVHAFNTLDSFIYGFALQERSLPFQTQAEMAEVGDRIMREMPTDAFPHLAEVVVELVGRGFTYADEFDFGLELILDGLEAIRSTSEPAG